MEKSKLKNRKIEKSQFEFPKNEDMNKQNSDMGSPRSHRETRRPPRPPSLTQYSGDDVSFLRAFLQPGKDGTTFLQSSRRGFTHPVCARIVRNCKCVKKALPWAEWTIPHYENGSLEQQFQIHSWLKMRLKMRSPHIIFMELTRSVPPVYPNRGGQYKVYAIPDPPTPP